MLAMVAQLIHGHPSHLPKTFGMATLRFQWSSQTNDYPVRRLFQATRLFTNLVLSKWGRGTPQPTALFPPGISVAISRPDSFRRVIDALSVSIVEASLWVPRLPFSTKFLLRLIRVRYPVSSRTRSTRSSTRLA